MGSVAVFFTVAATWWSSFAFLGSNATFYTHGPVYLTALAWNLLFGFMYYWVGKRVWFLGKKFNYITPSDLVGDFYNNEQLRRIVAIILLVFTIPYLQIQLTGGAYLIEIASGGKIPFGWQLYCFILLLLYTFGLEVFVLLHGQIFLWGHSFLWYDVCRVLYFTNSWWAYKYV